MLCSNLHCQKALKLTLFFYKTRLGTDPLSDPPRDTTQPHTLNPESRSTLVAQDLVAEDGLGHGARGALPLGAGHVDHRQLRHVQSQPLRGFNAETYSA